MGHTLIALKLLWKDWTNCCWTNQNFNEDLEKKQLLLKRFKPSVEGYPNPYEAWKDWPEPMKRLIKALGLYTLDVFDAIKSRIDANYSK
jgi:hypothetical protein